VDRITCDVWAYNMDIHEFVLADIPGMDISAYSQHT
jgi:hypothetical protein